MQAAFQLQEVDVLWGAVGDVVDGKERVVGVEDYDGGSGGEVGNAIWTCSA